MAERNWQAAFTHGSELTGHSIGMLSAMDAELQAVIGPQPEVPATPQPQDIVDALIAMGLITQAAPA